MPRPDEVTILCGGWSASRFDLQRLPGWVLGVNDAALHARCDAVLSMDRLWTEHRWERIRDMLVPVWIRRAALKNIQGRPFWLHDFDCDHTTAELSDQPGVLNGTNSGLCALNLAYQMRPRLIRLYGMDLKRGPRGEHHFYPDYDFKPAGKGTSDGKFAEWRADLARAVAQCRAKGIEVRTVTKPGDE